MANPVTGIAAPEVSAFLLLEGNAYAELGDLAGISFLGASAFTFEGWFYFNGLCPGAILLQKKGEFTLGTYGHTVFAQRAGQVVELQTTDAIHTNEWTHIACTFDGTTLSLYVNSMLSIATSTVGPGIADQGHGFRLGKNMQGMIKDFRIWNYARSQLQLYENEWVSQTPDTEGLVSDYNCTMVPPQDTSGNSNPITLYNGASSLNLTPTVVTETASYCEPIDDELLVNPGGAGNDSYSIVAWINLATTAGHQCIFSNGDLGQASGVFLGVDNGAVTAQRGGTTPTILTSNGILASQQWYCISYTYDGTNQYLYINGTLDSQAAASSIPVMDESLLCIGAANNLTLGQMQMHFAGYVQFVSVWNICLTAAQVTQWMYDNPTDQSGVVANYSFATESAINLQTGNPIGLALGAHLVQMRQAVPPTSQQLPQRIRRLAQLESLAPPASPAAANACKAYYTQACRDDILLEYKRALPLNMPKAARNQAIVNLREQLKRLSNGDTSVARSARNRYVVREEGEYRIIDCVGLDGATTEVLRRQVNALSPCVAAEFSLLIAIFDLFFGIVGVTVSKIDLGRFFTERITTEAAEIAQIARSGCSAGTVFKLLRTLFAAGFVTGVLQVAVSGLTWWEVFTMGVRFVAIFAPTPSYQKAFAIAQLALGIYELVTSWQAVNTACKSK
ncbi:MAG: LamG domain-containing protein [Burkholderiales bacterium]